MHLGTDPWPSGQRMELSLWHTCEYEPQVLARRPYEAPITVPRSHPTEIQETCVARETRVQTAGTVL